MKIRTCLFYGMLTVGMVLLNTIPALADGRTRGEMPIQVQLLSSNIGEGVSLGYNFNSTVFIGVESLLRKEEIVESQVLVTGDLTTHQLIARFSVWDDSGFYIELGAASRKWVIEGVGYSCVGDWPDYTCSDQIHIKWEWPAVAGVYGIGWNWIADFGFSGGLGISVYAGEDPELIVEDLNGGATEAQLQYEKKQIESYTNTAVGSLYFNIGWNF